MKKMILGLVMVVMMLGCVGCGKEEAKNVKEMAEIASENEGFVPEVVTEKEPVITEEVEEVIDEANLEKYYDVTEFVGTPRLEKMRMEYSNDSNIVIITKQYREIDILLTYKIKKPNDLLGSGTITIKGILCDNNTPDDLSDDLLAYIFTTLQQKNKKVKIGVDKPQPLCYNKITEKERKGKTV